MNRRTLLQQLAAVGALSATGGWNEALAQTQTAAKPRLKRRPRLVPWSNWSGGQRCLPAARLAPPSEDAIAELLKAATGVVRPVGASHSFSALVPTSGTLLSTGQLSGLISHDAERLQAEFWAGTPMSQMGAPLKEVGQALINMADIDYQTLAGAISTSTHGTGVGFGCYSSYVSGLRLITAKGEVLDCDAEKNPEVFRAARTSFGSLGVITRVRMQNRKPFRLHEHLEFRRLEEILEEIDTLKHQHDHFEFHAVLHSDMVLQQTLNETDDPVTRPKEGGGDGDKIGMLRAVHTYARNSPRIRAALMNALARFVPLQDVVDDSWKVFANVRDQRFHEMEYTVPAEAGPACLREIMARIRERNLDSFFPIEFRYVKADDIPLSMFGGRDGCSLSVHQSYEMDHHNFFAAIEPIFWKYEGRPHWGKLHTLNHAQLVKLYPQWKEFQELRRSLDPTGKFLNEHLRTVFGVSASC